MYMCPYVPRLSWHSFNHKPWHLICRSIWHLFGFLALHLVSILKFFVGFYLVSVLTFYLAFTLPFYLASYLASWHSILHSFCHVLRPTCAHRIRSLGRGTRHDLSETTPRGLALWDPGPLLPTVTTSGHKQKEGSQLGSGCKDLFKLILGFTLEDWLPRASNI